MASIWFMTRVDAMPSAQLSTHRPQWPSHTLPPGQGNPSEFQKSQENNNPSPGPKHRETTATREGGGKKETGQNH